MALQHNKIKLKVSNKKWESILSLLQDPLTVTVLVSEYFLYMEIKNIRKHVESKVGKTCRGSHATGSA